MSSSDKRKNTLRVPGMEARLQGGRKCGSVSSRVSTLEALDLNGAKGAHSPYISVRDLTSVVFPAGTDCRSAAAGARVEA